MESLVHGNTIPGYPPFLITQLYDPNTAGFDNTDWSLVVHETPGIITASHFTELWTRRERERTTPELGKGASFEIIKLIYVCNWLIT